MPDDSADGQRNPFATRYTRPGALRYLFDSLTAADLIDRLRAAAWRGEIVGPHGSGKSTLLATLVPLLRAGGCQVVETALRDGQRRLPRVFWQTARAWVPQALPVPPGMVPAQSTGGAGGTPLVLVVDGYEQLGWLARWQLHRWTRRRDIGLLLTSHRPTGLPRLWATEATLDRAARVVAALVAGTAFTVDRTDLARRLTRHHGNLREVLMELYDVWEEKSVVGGQGSGVS